MTHRSSNWKLPTLVVGTLPTLPWKTSSNVFVQVRAQLPTSSNGLPTAVFQRPSSNGKRTPAVGKRTHRPYYRAPAKIDRNGVPISGIAGGRDREAVVDVSRANRWRWRRAIWQGIGLALLDAGVLLLSSPHVFGI